MPPARVTVSDSSSSLQQAQQMPGPRNGANATSREDAALKPAPLNIGKQTGQFDTANVRHKIRKWQAEGGGTTADDNVVTVEYDEEEKGVKKEKKIPKPTPSKDKATASTDADADGLQTSPTKAGRSPPRAGAARMRTQREMDAERKAWVRRKSKPQNDPLEEEIKHIGTPKKRVVSDGHWRKDRSPPKKEDPPLSKPKYTVKRTVARPGEGSMASDKAMPDQDDGGIRVKPLKYDTKPIPDMDGDGIRVKPLKIVPLARSRSRERIRSSPATKYDNDHSGDAKDVYRRSSKTPGKENRTVSNEQGDDAFLHDKKRRTRRRRHDSPSSSDVDTGTIADQSIAPDDSISRINGQGPRRTRSPIYDERPLKERSSSRLRKAEKPTSQKQADLPDVTPPKIFGNRIEAWLDHHAPDPFVESENLRRPDSRERVSSSERRRPRTGDSDRKRSARFSSAVDSIYDEAAAEIKSTKSPVEESRKGSAKKTDHEDYASSASSSSVPSTEVELPPVTTSKHSPAVNLRRRFPTTGKPLSTIASVNTLRSSTPSEASDQGTIVPEQESDNPTGLKRRLTRHDDLLSVLSLPRAGSKSIASARSIRTSRTRLERATLQDIWGELAADEIKYQRELRTLVDGVIPVLLSCVLSKSDSGVAAGLFGGTASGAAVTQPIVDMGIALERLKSHHKRVPQSDIAALSTWAQSAVKIYTDYTKAWRMGFQDVVVNLAPADEQSKKELGWDEDLPRNQDGDLLNGDGERVDVAFLLKRPLVRLKYLSKTFKVRKEYFQKISGIWLMASGHQPPCAIASSGHNRRKVPAVSYRSTQEVE